jgi:hypothetical protein
MKARLVTLLTGVIGAATLCMLAQLAIAAEVPRMTKNELNSKLDDPDVVIVDVRVGKDWKGSEFKIKGAVRGDKNNINAFAGKYPKDKTFVLYCA